MTTEELRAFIPRDDYDRLRAIEGARGTYATRAEREKLQERYVPANPAPAGVAKAPEPESPPGTHAARDAEPEAGPIYGARPDEWAHFENALGLCADLLPVVSNTHAQIASGSSIKELGKTPSRYNASRRAVGIPAWTRKTCSSEDIANWSSEPDYGICVQTRNVRALDCDISDPELAHKIEAFVRSRLAQQLPCRKRANSSKFLLAFRLTGEHRKRTIKTAAGKIEFLGNGQQFVAVGTHPSGARYEWEGGLPAEIPELDIAEFEALWSALAEKFGAEKPKPADTPEARTDDLDRATKLAEVGDETVEHVRQAVLHLGPEWSDDYDKWVNVGQALKSLEQAGRSTEAEQLWHKFSALSPKYDHEQAVNKWESFNPDRITYKSIFNWAQRADWKNPKQGAAPKTPASRTTFQPAPRSASYLIKKVFKPVMFTIENLLPGGVFLLVASPKVGKSWLALQFAIAVASGGEVLREKAKQGDVLVLALEDNDRRLKSRLEKLNAELLPESALERLQFETQWPRVDDRGAELIAEWLAERPEARLVIIDVLEKIRPLRDAKANAYGEDYKALQALKGVAEKHGVSILVVHHTRKAASDDPMQLVSGTQGLAGAADGVLVLARARGERRGELTIMARDLEREGAFAVEFQECQWTMLGPAEQVAKTATQQAILETLQRHGEPIGPTQLAQIMGRSRQSVQQALARMAREGLVEQSGGKYAPSKDIDDVSLAEGVSCVAGVAHVDGGDCVSTRQRVNVAMGGVTRAEDLV
jgi:hypothetical protein